MRQEITLSVVSHGQTELVNQLLHDLRPLARGRLRAVVTLNIPDATALAGADAALPVEVIVNERAKGFGANHNAAFERCRTPYFCVANPDIRLPGDPFPSLLEELANSAAGVAGPLVRNALGEIEDSARRFPTAAALLKKLFVDRRQPDYPTDRGPLEVEWVAGMFMLFRAEAYRQVGGFDEAFFLYYEDVDICRRLLRAGKRVIYDPRAEVVHAARRASRRDLRHARHHAASVLRFLLRR
jgi:N-acetylglucosaminyl-diphospho-decaprenol L-rhamnosyltransferase